MEGLATAPRSALDDAVINAAFGAFQMLVFGEHYANESQDWTFRNLKEPGDERKDSSLTRHLPAIARELSVRRFLVPSPLNFPGNVITNTGELDQEIHLPGGVVVARGKEGDGVRLFARGQAYAVSTGGCPAIALWRTDRVGMLVTGHAGLRSLERYPEAGWGDFQSVTKSLLEALTLDGEDSRSVAQRCRGYVLLPIDPEAYLHPDNHPKFGEINWKRTRFLVNAYGRDVICGSLSQGGIDLAELIVRKFKKLGVPPDNIERGAHTGAVTRPVYTTREPTAPEDQLKRNLVIVTPR